MSTPAGRTAQGRSDYHVLRRPGSGVVRVELLGRADADGPALQRLVHEAFDEPDIQRVEVRLHAGARTARSVLDAMGAVHEATLRHAGAGSGGAASPPMIYALHRDELLNIADPQSRPAVDPRELTVRVATSADIGELFDLEQSAFGVGYDRGQLRQLLALFPGLTWLASLRGASVGYSTCGIVHDEPDAWILSMGVRRSWQSVGVGSALLTRSLQGLQDRGVSTVHLSVDPEKSRTVAFYRSHGFRPVEQVEDYFGPGEPRTIMRRDLGAR